MSAQLASQNSFSAHLALAAGVAVSITAPTLNDLQMVVTRLNPAANDITPGGTVASQPAPAAPVAAPQAAAGNAPASTGATAGAPPASNGSASGADKPQFTYDDVKSRVLNGAKTLGRDFITGELAKFKSVKGEPVDHGNKLQLQDYPTFIAAVDKALAAAPKA